MASQTQRIIMILKESGGGVYMEYKRLGKSGLWVSRLILGTMNFGSRIAEKDAFDIMDAALDIGINYFDTANNYGKSIQKEGISETIIGKWFEKGGGRREKVILSTKVYEPMRENNPNDVPGLSAYKVSRHFEDSLKRLKTDHVEIYYMHHVDRSISWDEVLPAFQGMIQRGDIDYLASSNFAGWNIADVQAEAKKANMFGLICEQHKYNLLSRMPELEVLPSAKNHGMGVVTWSPLAGGLLSRNARNREVEDEVLQIQLQKFYNLSTEIGEKEDTLALAWILKNPVITAPIIGPRTVEQLYDTVRAVEISIDDEIMEKLDEIFPGPGGQAPEAYAW